MSRLIVWVVVAVALVAGLFALSQINTERPLTKIEKVIPSNALAH